MATIKNKPMKLVKIQAELKAPKNQMNAFGKYKYRSAEDIIEAVKPILFKNNCALLISDEIVQVADRVYVKATAMLIDESNEDLPIKVYGWAREEEVKKGMDAAQITGSASSYARKYALNGLFAIDDTKDADSTNEHKDEVGEEKRMKLIALLENTIWDENLKSKQAIKISAYTTNEQYDKAHRIILANQNK
jgi:hypothetical protein